MTVRPTRRAQTGAIRNRPPPSFGGSGLAGFRWDRAAALHPEDGRDGIGNRVARGADCVLPQAVKQNANRASHFATHTLSQGAAIPC